MREGGRGSERDEERKKERERRGVEKRQERD